MAARKSAHHSVTAELSYNGGGEGSVSVICRIVRSLDRLSIPETGVPGRDFAGTFATAVIGQNGSGAKGARRRHRGEIAISRFVDLSRLISEDMAGINPAYSVRVRPFLTHADTAPRYDDNCSFEVSEVAFQVPVGTYLDSPRTRDREGRDIGGITLEELILPGLVIDARGRDADEPVRPDELPAAESLAGKAVLFDFGWAERYGTDAYDPGPYLSAAAVEHLVAARASLVGVDDRSPDGTWRPDHAGAHVAAPQRHIHR